MALFFMDGFDASDWLLGKWIVSQSYPFLNSSTRYNSGLCLGTNVQAQMVRKDFTAVSKLVVGFAFKATAFSDNNYICYASGDNGSVAHIGLYTRLNGSLAIVRGGTNTVVAASAAGVLALNTWHYLELSMTVSDTVGVATARVDGVQVCTFTGDTKNAGTNATLDRIDFNGCPSTTYIDDIYLLDGTGPAPWNDFLGDVRVQLIKPNGAGSQTDLTPVGVANNWDNVNELPFSSADYNASATVGARDLYAMEDISTLTTTVYGVQVTAAAHKNDSLARAAKTLVKSGGTVVASTARGLALTPSIATSIFQANPNTSAQWTPAEVNAMETGIEVA
jgi:hypothetical protein